MPVKEFAIRHRPIVRQTIIDILSMMNKTTSRKTIPMLNTYYQHASGLASKDDDCQTKPRNSDPAAKLAS
jgi:hypothetical protein